MKRIICALFGHKTVKGLFEDEEIISDTGCNRCGAVLMNSRSYWKGIPKPPWSDEETWRKYKDEEQASLRKQYADL